MHWDGVIGGRSSARPRRNNARQRWTGIYGEDLEGIPGSAKAQNGGLDRPSCRHAINLRREGNTDRKQQAPRQRSALQDVVTREYTINVHKRTHDLSFKKSAFYISHFPGLEKGVKGGDGDGGRFTCVDVEPGPAGRSASLDCFG